jgi:chromosome segregation ATPase
MMQFGDNTQTHDLARENETLRAENERLTEEVNALRLVATAHDAEVERLRAQTNNAIAKQYDAEGEIERLRAALQELTADISSSAVLMDNISLAKFENACAALEPKP